MNSRRPRPYVWVSWITSLLSESDKCEWKVWTKSQFRYAKLQGDSTWDVAEWTRQHNEMVEARAVKLRQQGFEVLVEDQNSFKLQGEKGDLAGKCDIVALKHADKYALIIDEKSGKERPSDIWQVKIYVWAKRLLSLKGWHVDGEVEYRGRSEPVPMSSVDSLAVAKIAGVLKMATGEVAPRRTPSQRECSWCDIDGCPERFKGASPGNGPESTNASNYF